LEEKAQALFQSLNIKFAILQVCTFLSQYR